MTNAQAWQGLILQVLKILRIFYNKIKFYQNNDILMLLKINLKISTSRQQSFKKKFQHVQILCKKSYFQIILNYGTGTIWRSLLFLNSSVLFELKLVSSITNAIYLSLIKISLVRTLLQVDILFHILVFIFLIM